MKTTHFLPWRLTLSAGLTFTLAHLFWALPASAATTIHVPTGTNITTIQDGINAAVNGDTVLVSDGTYPGGINFNGKLILVKSANGPANCIIDGNDKDLGVAFTGGEGAAARLEGVTLRNCRSFSGGALHITSLSAPTIAGCIITNNRSVVSAGGGINIEDASPTITNCIVSGNWAGIDSLDNYSCHGGGISCKGQARPLIVDCLVSTNHAYGLNGGGIYCYNSSPTIRNCTIVGNSVYQDGGGISCKDNSSAPLIIGCTISGNSGGSQGGGISIENCFPTISHCIISDNRAEFDGGISCWNNAFPMILDCTIARNRATYGYDKYRSAGGIGMQMSSPLIANCLIWGNSSYRAAGGILIRDSSFPTIVNCTITANQARSTTSTSVAGGMYSADSIATIVNCILWGDIPTEIFVENTILYPNRLPVVSYSDVHWQGTGNIHADPLFVDPADGNFRLQAGSPCIDASASAKSPEDDIEGTPRPQDGNADGLAIVDMGAYELAGPSALLTGFLLDPADPNYIPDSAFRNATNRLELASTLQSVLQMIQRDESRHALDKLHDDILSKVDGCAATGAPDPDDWIVDCQHQALAYQRVIRAIAGLLPLARASGSIQVGVAEGYCWIGLPTEPASTYQLQCSTNLSSWDTLVANIPGTGDYYQVLDPAPVTSQGMRCYRAVQFFGPAPGEPAGNPDPAAWAWVSPGSFAMGSGANSAGSESDEKPATAITLTKGMWVSRHEVTQQEYLAVMGNNPAWFAGDTNRPVENVSWNDATNYCVLLTAREQAAGRLPAGYVYRLPTEAEWEYACRAGSTTTYCYGDDPTGSELGFYAWYWDNSGSTNVPSGFAYYINGTYYVTHPVGTRQMNRWGLSDMHGSVWEWCLDWHGPYPGGSVTDPQGATIGTARVIRGGNWNGGLALCRSANRSAAFPGGASSGIGFRAVLAQ